MFNPGKGILTSLLLPTMIVTMAAGAAGCAGNTRGDIRTEQSVDLARFMGSWYVIANIPTFIEKDIYNAVERYELGDDNKIDTTFTYRKGGFDGDAREMNPTGFVEDTDSNAVWSMQFIWPFKADYRIVYVADDYSQTIIGRNKRDYAWIMAREPAIAEADYERLVAILIEQGYDISKLRKVPQRW